MQKVTSEKTSETFRRMLSANRSKYGFFLKALDSADIIAKLLFIDTRRAHLLKDAYAVMRDADDIADRDMQPPNEYTPSEYMKKLIAFSEQPHEFGDEMESRLKQCFDLAENIGFNIRKECGLILESLLFDAERYGKQKIFSAEELHAYFDQLDVRGTTIGASKVFMDSEDKVEYVEKLSYASRIFYTLRDLSEDLVAGFINIPKEVVEKNNISKFDLEQTIELSKTNVNYMSMMHEMYNLELKVIEGNYDNPFKKIKKLSKKISAMRAKKKEECRERKRFIQSLPKGIKQWYADEVNKGLLYLSEYKENLENVKLKKLTKSTFYWIYERPAKTFFEEVSQYLG